MKNPAYDLFKLRIDKVITQKEFDREMAKLLKKYPRKEVNDLKMILKMFGGRVVKGGEK